MGPDYTGGIVDGESFIGGGVKIDNNGLTSGSGNTQSADMVFNTITIEQPAGEAFIWIPASAEQAVRLRWIM